MQDLGRIVIDINEGGGGKTEGVSGIGNIAEAAGGEAEGAEAAAAAAEELGALAAVSAGVAAAFAAIATVVVGAVAVLKQVIKAMQWMHVQIMDFASSIADFSPDIALAEMDNQLKMAETKFQMGAAVGGQIAGYIGEIGGIERTITEIRGYMAGIFAAILKPIMRAVNAGLDYLKQFLPAIIDGIASLIDGLGNFMDGFAQFAGRFSDSVGNAIGVVAHAVHDMAKDIRSIKTNTQKDPNFSQINQAFINDLRLMGARI